MTSIIPELTIKQQTTTNSTKMTRSLFQKSLVLLYYNRLNPRIMNAAHDTYENDYAYFSFKEDILFITYKPNITLNLKVAQLVVADRIRFQNEKSYLILCDIRGIVHSEKAGRDYLAHSGSLLIKAVSLLVHENVLLSMTTFYLQVSRPPVPTQIFTDEGRALAYLKSFL